MAVPDSAPSDLMAAQLNSLLRRAKEIKQSNSIDPPLPVANLVNGDEPLFVQTLDSKEIHSNAFETAARTLFYQILASTPIQHPSFVFVWNLLDILQYCGDRELCSPQLVLLLIEELLDSQSIDGCRIVFGFLESRRETIIATTSKNKDLVILRLCNELLRRLSRADDSVFCGRVYIFMFQSFPLGDRSSVNLRGNFHVENVTTFEDYLRSSAADDQMQIDVEPPAAEVQTEETQLENAASDEEKKKPAVMDTDTLYPVFWSLQNSFSDPPQLFKEENLKTFQRGLEATIAKFKDVPAVIQSGDSDERREDDGSPNDDHDQVATTFNPKYLTSHDLFELELSDVAFQRHILVQALILIDFLLTLTERSKNEPSYRNAQKAMQYSFTLREEDTEWALGIKRSIENYLRAGPDGQFYYRTVDTVLSRDKNWVRWKMENCQPFTRDRAPTSFLPDAKSGAQHDLSKRTLKEPAAMPKTLGYLSHTNAKKGLERLEQAARSTVLPSMDSYRADYQAAVKEVDVALDDADREQALEKKTSSTWRGLRVASLSKLNRFDKVEPGTGLERLFDSDSSIEAPGEDMAPTSAPEGRDSVPQEQHPSVEEQRPDQTSQVTADTAEELQG